MNDMGEGKTVEAWDEWTAKMQAAHGNGNGHGKSLAIEAQRMSTSTGLHNLLICCGPIPPGGTPGCCEGRYPTCWCGGAVGLRVPGDAAGLGCLADITHNWQGGAGVDARLLPTPSAQLAAGSQTHRSGARADELLLDGIAAQDRWGDYAAAIARWEHVTRPAPEPTNITEGYLKARAKRLARLDRRPVGMRGSLKVRRQLAARFSEWMMGLPDGWITDVPGITRNEALKAAGNGVVPQQAAEALRFLLAMPTGCEIADAYEPTDLLECLAVEA